MPVVIEHPTRWRDVEVGHVVHLPDGNDWTVAKLKARDKKTIVVTVERGGKKFKAPMPAKAEVNVITKSSKGSIQARESVAWSADDTPAEAEVKKRLGGVLVGVQLAADEEWIVPEVDQSTIASHLYLFHGVEAPDVRKPGGYEAALEQHAESHDSGGYPFPHRHAAERPSVGVGKRG